MITIRIAYPHEDDYRRVSAFAKSIYADRLQSVTAAAPDVFAYAIADRHIIGCLGLSRADKHPTLLFETCDPPDPCERLVGTSCHDRSLIGELGTRAVDIPQGSSLRSIDVSIALTGVAACEAYASGIQYLGFVTNKLVRRITDPLGFEVMHLGEPDFSAQDEAFRENMRGFLAVRQLCMGFRIQCLSRCRSTLESFAKNGVELPSRLTA